MKPWLIFTTWLMKVLNFCSTILLLLWQNFEQFMFQRINTFSFLKLLNNSLRFMFIVFTSVMSKISDNCCDPG